MKTTTDTLLVGKLRDTDDKKSAHRNKTFITVTCSRGSRNTGG